MYDVHPYKSRGIFALLNGVHRTSDTVHYYWYYTCNITT